MPRDLCPAEGKPDKKKKKKKKTRKQEKGVGRFSEERRVLGGLEVGLGSLGAPPATFKSGNPHFLPTLSFPALAHWGPGGGPLSAAAPRGPLARGGPRQVTTPKPRFVPQLPQGRGERHKRQRRRQRLRDKEGETEGGGRDSETEEEGERWRGERDRGRRERDSGRRASLRDRGDSEMEGAGE